MFPWAGDWFFVVEKKKTLSCLVMEIKSPPWSDDVCAEHLNVILEREQYFNSMVYCTESTLQSIYYQGFACV